MIKKLFDEKPIGFVNFLNKLDLENKKIMDLACGIGRTCKWLAPKAKSCFQNAEYHVNNGKTLKNFKDQSFDLIFCELAFQHMEKQIQESYVKEVFRILNNNYYFYVQIPRFEFYKDSTYARTKEETEELMKKISIEYIDISDAYYVIKAKKTE